VIDQSERAVEVPAVSALLAAIRDDTLVVAGNDAKGAATTVALRAGGNNDGRGFRLLFHLCPLWRARVRGWMDTSSRGTLAGTLIRAIAVPASGLDLRSETSGIRALRRGLFL